MAQLAPYNGTRVIEAAETREDKDRMALDSIQHLLQDPEWGVGMLEDIAELVSATGREVEDAEDEDGEPISTWGRH